MNNQPAEKNRRILVIDDNRAIHDDFRKILSPDLASAAALDATETAVFGPPTDAVRQTPFEVDSAYQGQDGVLMVKTAMEAGRPYAMAFVDVRMPPGWDGVETTRKIWELDPNLQVVLCTAYSDYSWGEMFEKLGHRDGLLILKKPFDTVEAFQLAHALTEKWRLHQESRRKMEELESRVVARTGELQGKTAFLEAQVNSSIDGILVVDQEGKQALQNQRFVELLKIPQHIADEKADENRLRWVTDMTKNPEQFVEKVRYLYAHPDEISRDELELKDGTVLDRYSSPVVGQDGKYYGRIWTFRDITGRKRTEEQLRVQATALEAVANSIVITDATGTIQWVNPAFTALTGYSAEEAIGNNPRILKGGKQDEAYFRSLWQTISSGQVWSGELTNRRKDGSLYDEEMTITPLRNAEGAITRYIAIKQDITERKRLEAQLFQSQKLETVGKLAGGVAHEFNSIMTAIIGQSELLLSELPSGNPLHHNASEIRKASERAATLTRQLLAYGRKQILQPETLDLNRVVADMDGMLRQLVGGEVDLRIVPAVGLKAVKADAGQIEQVIMNMAINAHEAMPHGGKLTLETSNVTLDQESVGRYPELKPGDHVMLAISDTGTGMNGQVKARIFEPFFTTKGVGEGTGLGLATCYGIVKQSGGHITVYSEPGRGTTFKIYLPQVEPQSKASPSQIALPALPHGTETILLVEDDLSLREMASTLLQRLGYTVLAAANGEQALSLVEQRGKQTVDLLFTDVVMPRMDGRELSDRIRATHPETKILFTSAYTENAIVHQGVLDTGVALLQKPFTPTALAHRLREVLDAQAPPRQVGRAS